jgi:hypothetical protein
MTRSILQCYDKWIDRPTTMLKTITGIYQDGKIQIAQPPQGFSNNSKVLITFVDRDNLDPGQLDELIDRLETVAGIQQGFEELNAGRSRPIEDFAQEMQQKYGISG